MVAWLRLIVSPAAVSAPLQTSGYTFVAEFTPTSGCLQGSAVQVRELQPCATERLPCMQGATASAQS